MTYKSTFLKKCPTAFCKKEEHDPLTGFGINGYFTYLNEEEEKKKNSFTHGITPHITWRRACLKWETIEELDKR